MTGAYVNYFAANAEYFKENWNGNPCALKNAIAEKIADPNQRAAAKAELFEENKEDSRNYKNLSCYIIEHTAKHSDGNSK